MNTMQITDNLIVSVEDYFMTGERSKVKHEFYCGKLFLSFPKHLFQIV